MFCCLDVDYRPRITATACLGFEGWDAANAIFEQVVHSPAAPATYEPGFFYRRELPYLLQVISQIKTGTEIILIDGYVWLGDHQPGLGAHLYEALDQKCAVVGVAKRPFRNASNAIPVLRGGSQQPLFVTAVGIDVKDAVDGVRSMHGKFRIPTLLKSVDRLCRAA